MAKVWKIQIAGRDTYQIRQGDALGPQDRIVDDVKIQGETVAVVDATLDPIVSITGGEVVVWYGEIP